MREGAIWAKAFTKIRQKLHAAKNDRPWVNEVGKSKISNAAPVTLEKFSRNCSTLWPWYSTRGWNKLHLFRFDTTTALRRRVNTSSTWPKCSSTVFKNTIKLSRYTRHVCQRTPREILLNAHWNFAGALFNPGSQIGFQRCFVPICVFDWYFPVPQARVLALRSLSVSQPVGTIVHWQKRIRDGKRIRD